MNTQRDQSRRGRSGTRSPLMAGLRRALSLARLAGQPGSPPVDELVELAREADRKRANRREFLIGAGAATLSLGLAGRSQPLHAAPPSRRRARPGSSSSARGSRG